jgi:glucose-1-phosphate adenylyltransferase
MCSNVHCVIMGGGRGSRLYPLTKKRCKPAVPLAGQYRLVDIPISNCINSGFNRIYLLTQFNTASLHRHIHASFRFDPFGGGFVEILSAEQTERSEDWYQGTADAVRKNLNHINAADDDLFLILSGDQLYRIDLRQIIDHHIAVGADVTLAAKPVLKEHMEAFGAIQVNDDLSISAFVEKPKKRSDFSGLVLNEKLKSHLNAETKAEHCLASMGIYVFKAKALKEALANGGSDFGKEILPSLLGKNKLFCYIFNGYWEDIGTVKAFFEANLMLTELVPKFNFFDAQNPIYTHFRHLPAAKLNSCKINKALICGGVILTEAEIIQSVIGLRSYISKGSKLENVVMMGADRYETLEEIANNTAKGVPNLGIGEQCVIQKAIIDKNVRIGNKVRLSPYGKSDNYDDGKIVIRDGILCVLSGAIIPDGTVI